MTSARLPFLIYFTLLFVRLYYYHYNTQVPAVHTLYTCIQCICWYPFSSTCTRRPRRSRRARCSGGRRRFRKNSFVVTSTRGRRVKSRGRLPRGRPAFPPHLRRDNNVMVRSRACREKRRNVNRSLVMTVSLRLYGKLLILFIRK